MLPLVIAYFSSNKELLSKTGRKPSASRATAFAGPQHVLVLFIISLASRYSDTRKAHLTQPLENT